MKTAWVDEAALAALERLKKQKRKSSINEVICFLIGEHTVFEQQKVNVEVPKEDDSLRCMNRIIHDGCYWCVNKPPNMIKLLTLDICKVCKQRKLGLTESTKIPQPQNRFPLYKGNEPLKKYETIYCLDGGFEVPISKCEICKKTSFPKWDDCQKQRRQKGMEKETQ